MNPVPSWLPLLFLFLLLRLVLGPVRLLWGLAGHLKGGRLVLCLACVFGYVQLIRVPPCPLAHCPIHPSQPPAARVAPHRAHRPSPMRFHKGPGRQAYAPRASPGKATMHVTGAAGPHRRSHTQPSLESNRGARRSSASNATPNAGPSPFARQPRRCARYPSHRRTRSAPGRGHRFRAARPVAA